VLVGVPQVLRPEEVRRDGEGVVVAESVLDAGVVLDVLLDLAAPRVLEDDLDAEVVGDVCVAEGLLGVSWNYLRKVPSSTENSCSSWV
jgi:hypothetical protein